MYGSAFRECITTASLKKATTNGDERALNS
jgi:hypothetical protein